MDEELTYQKFIIELDNFLKFKQRKWGSKTLRNNLYYFNTLFIPYLKGRPFSRTIIEDFFNSMDEGENGRSTSTRHQAETSILQFVIWLSKLHKIKENWSPLIARTEVKRVPRILPNQDDVQKAIRRVCEPKKTDNRLSKFSKNEHMYCLLAMITWGGTRNYETRSIKLSEVHLPTNEVEITKGKTGARVIVIPKIPWLIEELQRRVNGRTPEELRCIANRKHYKRDNSDMLFVVNAGRLEAIMREVGKSFGIPMNVHDLRRICLRDLYDNGAPLDEVQHIAGHASSTTTQLYLNYSTRGQKKTLRNYSSETRKYHTNEEKHKEAIEYLSKIGILLESPFDNDSSTFKLKWT